MRFGWEPLYYLGSPVGACVLGSLLVIERSERIAKNAAVPAANEAGDRDCAFQNAAGPA